ncbi:MAG: hypothetical protein ACXQS8_06945, partial [Candidatus Helarchaeales archaeon]
MSLEKLRENRSFSDEEVIFLRLLMKNASEKALRAQKRAMKRASKKIKEESSFTPQEVLFFKESINDALKRAQESVPEEARTLKIKILKKIFFSRLFKTSEEEVDELRSIFSLTFYDYVEFVEEKIIEDYRNLQFVPFSLRKLDLTSLRKKHLQEKIERSERRDREFRRFKDAQVRENPEKIFDYLKKVGFQIGPVNRSDRFFALRRWRGKEHWTEIKKERSTLRKSIQNIPLVIEVNFFDDPL